MSSTVQLAKIKQQIAALERQAQQLLRVENKKVIERVRALISKHGLSAADLGFSDAGGPKSVSGSSPKGAKRRTGKLKSGGVPLYRDPASGKTWTGRGKPPAWIAGTNDRSSFLIGRPVTEAPPRKPETPLRTAKQSKRAGSTSKARKLADDQGTAAQASEPKVHRKPKAAKKAVVASKGRAPVKQRAASALPTTSKKARGLAAKRSRKLSASDASSGAAPPDESAAA
jgi:DNA-binding protein H-NS